MTGDSPRTISVASQEEFAAYLLAFSLGPAAPEASIRAPGRFEVRDADGSSFDLEVQMTANMPASGPSPSSIDEIMARAVAFSADNPPHHPGTIARFPMPSDRFNGCVEVPLAVLAVTGGRPGIYAPPRVAVVAWQTGEPRGIGEFPGFAPENWPPPRLGDWPPLALRSASTEYIAASVTRLSGCLGRLIDHALGNRPDREATDITDAKTLMRRLDGPNMAPYYASLSPAFAAVLAL